MPRSTSSTSRRIPLFKFPILISEEILKNFDSLQVLEFSTLSKRACRLIQNSNLNVKPMIGIEISNKAKIAFHIADDGYDCDLIWCIGSFTVPRKYDLIRISTLSGTKRIEDKRRKKRHDVEPRLKYALNARCPWTFLNKALEHLFSIFPGLQVRDLVLDSLQKFDVKVGLASVHTVENIFFNGNMVNNKLKYVMEKVTVTKSFSNYATFSMGCGIQEKLLCSEDIYSANSSWMSPERLSQFNCQKMRLFSTRISAKDVETYLQEWIETDKYNKVQTLEISLYDDGAQIDFEKLGAEVWDPAKRPQSYDYHNQAQIDCADGLDITKKDGTIASIFVYGDNTFVMLVWPKIQEE